MTYSFLSTLKTRSLLKSLFCWPKNEIAPKNKIAFEAILKTRSDGPLGCYRQYMSSWRNRARPAVPFGKRSSVSYDGVPACSLLSAEILPPAGGRSWELVTLRRGAGGLLPLLGLSNRWQRQADTTIARGSLREMKRP